MKPENNPQISDETTGLRPLEELDPPASILLLGWYVSEGVVALPANQGTVAVRHLHVRGLVQGDKPGEVEWAQFFVSVPVEHALDVSADLAKGTTESFDATE